MATERRGTETPMMTDAPQRSTFTFGNASTASNTAFSFHLPAAAARSQADPGAADPDAPQESATSAANASFYSDPPTPGLPESPSPALTDLFSPRSSRSLSSSSGLPGSSVRGSSVRGSSVRGSRSSLLSTPFAAVAPATAAEGGGGGGGGGSRRTVIPPTPTPMGRPGAMGNRDALLSDGDDEDGGNADRTVMPVMTMTPLSGPGDGDGDGGGGGLFQRASRLSRDLIGSVRSNITQGIALASTTRSPAAGGATPRPHLAPSAAARRRAAAAAAASSSSASPFGSRASLAGATPRPGGGYSRSHKRRRTALDPDDDDDDDEWDGPMSDDYDGRSDAMSAYSGHAAGDDTDASILLVRDVSRRPGGLHTPYNQQQQPYHQYHHPGQTPAYYGTPAYPPPSPYQQHVGYAPPPMPSPYPQYAYPFSPYMPPPLPPTPHHYAQHQQQHAGYGGQDDGYMHEGGDDDDGDYYNGRRVSRTGANRDGTGDGKAPATTTAGPSRWFSLDAPAFLMGYLQLAWNVMAVAALAIVVLRVYSSVQEDLSAKVDALTTKLAIDIQECGRQYDLNKCHPSMRTPISQVACQAWEECMARDPSKVHTVAAGAEAFAEILDVFIGRLSSRTLLVFVAVVVLYLTVNWMCSCSRSRSSLSGSRRPLHIPPFSSSDHVNNNNGNNAMPSSSSSLPMAPPSSARKPLGGVPVTPRQQQQQQQQQIRYGYPGGGITPHSTGGGGYMPPPSTTPGAGLYSPVPYGSSTTPGMRRRRG